MSEQGIYGGVFQTRQAPVRAEARVLTFAEVRDRRLAFVATIDYRVRRGELRTIAVRLRNWKGKDVQLEADQVLQRRADDRDANSRVWLLDLQSGVSGTYRVALRGSIPAEGLVDFLMPDVQALGVTREERWLALARPELQATDPWGLVELSRPEATRALAPWSGEAERLRRAGGAVWRVQSDRWRLRLQPRPALAGGTPVRLVLSEQSAAVLDGGRWLHQASYWLFHEAGTALDVHLPAGATVMAVDIDGVEVPRLQPASGHLWLPLPGGAGARCVTLRWFFDPSAEHFEKPNLEAPRLGPATALAEGALEPDAQQEAYREVPTLWTVHVPAGYRLNRQPGQAGTASAAGEDLRRAQAQAQLSELLAARAQGPGGEVLLSPLRSAQDRFYRFCRQAEYRLAQATGLDAGPDGQNLLVWLSEIKARNRRQMTRYEELRARAEQQAHLLGPHNGMPIPPLTEGEEPENGPVPPARVAVEVLPDTGTPTYWLTRAGYPSLQFDLVRTTGRPLWRCLAASALLVLMLLGLEGRLAQLSGAAVWAWRFWPEELALLALLTWPVLGIPLAGVLLVLAVCGRLQRTVRWMRTILRRPAAPAAETGGVST